MTVQFQKSQVKGRKRWGGGWDGEDGESGCMMVIKSGIDWTT